MVTTTAPPHYLLVDQGPIAHNHLTDGILRCDSRGRVRFTFNTIRYEVSRSGRVTVYERTTYGHQGERARWADGLLVTEASNPALLRTLANAIELAQS